MSTPITAENNWSPSDPINKSTPLSPLCACLGQGQFDISSWALICSTLERMNIKTVGDLEELFSENDMVLMAVLRSLEAKLKESARWYLSGLATATNVQFQVFDYKAKGKGADWNSKCTKLNASGSFQVARYTPDGRLFEKLPAKYEVDFLRAEDLARATDFFWLDAVANDEESMGEYLPLGMPRRLGKVWLAVLPPPVPYRYGEKKYEKERSPADIISLRFQNARSSAKPYDRCVLDEKFKKYFGEKIVHSVTFVDADDERLLDNDRNILFGELIDVYRNKTLPPITISVDAVKGKAKKNSPERKPFAEHSEQDKENRAEEGDLGSLPLELEDVDDGDSDIELSFNMPPPPKSSSSSSTKQEQLRIH